MKRNKDFFIEKLILASGLVAILFVVLIFGFLLVEGGSFFREYNILNFLSGKLWYPTSSPPNFGILSLIMGSLFVTLGAAAVAVPFGVMAALYIAEVAPPGIKDFLKSGVELLAAIPSVVIGFIGMVTVVPLIRSALDLSTG